MVNIYVTTYPAGCYNLPCWLLQLTPLAVTTCPAGCYNLPRWLLQLAPLAVTTCPAGCYNLPRWLLQLAPLAVTTCPAGCYNLPRWLLQLAPLAVTTCTAGCYNLPRTGVNCNTLVKRVIAQMCIASSKCLCTCYLQEIFAVSLALKQFRSDNNSKRISEICCFCYN